MLSDKSVAVAGASGLSGRGAVGQLPIGVGFRAKRCLAETPPFLLALQAASRCKALAAASSALTPLRS